MKNLFLTIKQGLRKVCIKTVNNFATMKRKYIRENQTPFMTRSRPRNIFNKIELR